MISKESRDILDIAIPSIVSNITVPLLGLIDVAIVGHLGSASYIGAIAVGGMLFNIIYWIFGFLRMGTSGMVSQAFGARDKQEVMRLLIRSLFIAAAVSLALILLRHPFSALALTLIEATAEVREGAGLYFNICVMGAPAVLGLYSFTGWFIGMQNSKAPMVIAIWQNVVNIACSLCFVFLLDMKIEGVAYGTVVAQYAGLIMALAVWRWKYSDLPLPNGGYFETTALKRFFRVNSDIFLRTLCIVAVTLYFTAAGSSMGEIILAVNTLLMQLFTLFSYIMDGFAYAAEALSGKAVGAGDGPGFRRVVDRLFKWGIWSALAFTLIYAAGGLPFLHLLTDEVTVIEASADYYLWAVAIPLAGFSAFLYDGIFIGCTATRVMLRSMAIAAACFFAVYFSLRTTMANHALWLAFLTYLFIRGVMERILGAEIINKNIRNTNENFISKD